MSKPNTRYLDGYPAPERETTVIAQPDFPFENYSAPDLYARTLDRMFDVTPNGFTPKIGTRTNYTNYILQSQTFGTTWTTSNATATGAQLANPSNGTVDAYSLLETVANAEHYLTQAYTFTATATTLSFFLQQNGRTWARIKANDGTTNFTAFFNLGTGQTGSVANCTSTITNAGFGYYRCSITFTPLAALGAVFVQPSTDGSTVSYAGNTALGLYVWGAQLERASSAGPYISTLAALRTISAPIVDYLRPTATATDPGDLFAYLVKETSPQNETSTNAVLRRTFGRIPANETSYPGSIYIPLPSPVNQFNGASTLIALSLQYNRPLGSGAYQGNTLYTSLDNGLYRGKVVESAVAGEATGGTFTITYRASTSGALNWNDSNATIAAAINAIGTVVSDGITVSAGNELSSGGRLALTMVLTSIPSGWPYPFTMNAGSLTVTTSKNPVTSITSGNSQFIYLPDHLTITGHGFNTGVPLAAANYSNRLVVMAVGYWGSIDANTIWLPAAQVSSQSIWAIAGDFIRVYPAGNTVLLRSTTIEEFSLPGVTSGITTPADITSPIGLQATDAFLNALVTTSGFQTYRSEGPLPWMDSLIYTVKRVQINLSDVT